MQEIQPDHHSADSYYGRRRSRLRNRTKEDNLDEIHKYRVKQPDDLQRFFKPCCTQTRAGLILVFAVAGCGPAVCIHSLRNHAAEIVRLAPTGRRRIADQGQQNLAATIKVRRLEFIAAFQFSNDLLNSLIEYVVYSLKQKHNCTPHESTNDRHSPPAHHRLGCAPER